MLGLSVRENLGLPDGWLTPWAGFEGPEAEPTAPGDTRLPRRSSIVVMPVSAVVKTCV